MSNQVGKNARAKKKKHLALYAYMVLILLILTTVTTYAWLALTSTPRVSNLSIYINTFPGMEIAVDPEKGEWSQRISYEEMFGEEYELRPATWSEEHQAFFGASYSITGKLQKDKWTPLTDEVNANNTTANNYYCIGSFYARTGSDTQISLAPALAINDGLAASGTYLIGEPLWNQDKILHENNGKGAENAIRIGIRVNRLNSDYTPTGETEFFIYEPNANAHSDGSVGYVSTPSIDGEDTLINSENIISQGASSWTENDPVERDVLVHYMGAFDGSSDLFKMKADEVVQIEIIIWLEGQDVDCTNAIADASIIANLQFHATVIGGGGMVPIPTESE